VKQLLKAGTLLLWNLKTEQEAVYKYVTRSRQAIFEIGTVIFGLHGYYQPSYKSKELASYLASSRSLRLTSFKP
jgi:hypothetical protein